MYDFLDRLILMLALPFSFAVEFEQKLLNSEYLLLTINTLFKKMMISLAYIAEL